MNSTLKLTPRDSKINDNTYFKVVKSQVPKSKTVKRIYINTLIPGFSYKNNLGEIIKPKKCVLL